MSQFDERYLTMDPVQDNTALMPETSNVQSDEDSSDVDSESSENYVDDEDLYKYSSKESSKEEDGDVEEENAGTGTTSNPDLLNQDRGLLLTVHEGIKSNPLRDVYSLVDLQERIKDMLDGFGTRMAEACDRLVGFVSDII